MLSLTAILVVSLKMQTFKANWSTENFVFSSMSTADKCSSEIHLFVGCYCQSDVIINNDFKNNTTHDL